MQTYAEILVSTNTVKALNEIAKRMGLKGYSKLRKAALAQFIAESIVMPEPTLSVEEPADHATIAALVAEFATPVKAAESAVETTEAETEEEPTLDELVTAYGLMKATWNRARGERAKSLLVRLLKIRAQVKAKGFDPRMVGLGVSVA